MARLPIARVEPDWTVVASHELSRRIGFARLGDLSEPRVITIRPSGGLTVTVQGPNSAVGGADVTLYLAGDPVTTVEADSSGVARLLVPGDPRIHAWVGVAAPGFVSRTIYEIPRTGSLLARLTPAGAMSVVVQTADSAAVAGARLELRPNDTTISQPVARGETDTEGRGYLCFGLPEGMRASSYWLSASAEGFADTALRLEGRTLPTDPLKVTLHRSRTVDVHVVDSRNLGVPYATVFALELRGADGRRTLFAPHNLLRNPLQTDESGHITLTHLSSASALGVYAYDREAGFGHVELVPARSKCNTTVVLARHADVLVQVLSAADGARIEDAVVELWKTSGIPSLVARQVQSASSVFSNSDGWATISGLPVDASALSVRDRFGRMIPRLVQLRADVLEYQVRLRPFARVDGLVHAAESLPRPLTIRAQLMGRPDPDRFNELHEGVTSREVMIFQGNTFALDKLLPNREYCISVVGLSDAASGRGMMITRAPATRVPLYLGETAWAPVRVKINGLTGPAIVSMDIWGKGRDGDPIRLHQDRVLNHSHVVDFQLPPGRNWVRIVSIHAFPHVQWLDVPPDGTSIDVELQEQETIVTKVIDAEGQPVRNATVTLEGRPRLPGPDGRLIPCGATQATTDATGQAVLPLPPSRQWALEVRRGTSKMVGRTEGKGVPNAPIVVVLDIDKPR
jgi:hypothetical protein